MGKLSTLLWVAAAAAVALFAWAYVKSKQPGATGGVWGTITGLVGGAMGLTQNVTKASVETGKTAGNAVLDAVKAVTHTGSGILDETVNTTKHILTLGFA